MPNFSKMIANYPFHFIAGLGAVGAAAKGLTTRYRDNESVAGMSVRRAGRGMMGLAGGAAIGAGIWGANRYGGTAAGIASRMRGMGSSWQSAAEGAVMGVGRLAGRDMRSVGTLGRNIARSGVMSGMLGRMLKSLR